MKWILCIGPTYNVWHLPFQNDYLSNFELVTYLWLMVFKNLIYDWKWSKFSHNSQTWFTLVQVCVIKRIVHILLSLGLIWSWFMLEPWFLWMVAKNPFLLLPCYNNFGIALFHLVKCFFKVCHWTKVGLGG